MGRGKRTPAAISFIQRASVVNFYRCPGDYDITLRVVPVLTAALAARVSRPYTIHRRVKCGDLHKCLRVGITRMTHLCLHAARVHTQGVDSRR